MRLQDHMPAGIRVSGLSIVTAVALFVTSGFVLASLATVLSAGLESSVQSEDADVVSKILANNRVLDQSEKRFTGRSIFYIPRAPRVPTPPPPPRVVTEAPPPPPIVEEPPPRIPSTYGGPAITGILGKEVFFDNNKRIPEGQESDGVKVMVIRGPFNVQLGWKGGEYELDLFTKELPDYFSEPPFADGGASDLFNSPAAPASSTRTASQGSSSDRSSAQMSAREMSNQRAAEAARERAAPAEIPEPLDPAKLAEMDRMDAIRAMTKINSALRRQDIDQETKTRLQSDRKQLETRIRSAAQNK
jgi:hypothetical protein